MARATIHAGICGCTTEVEAAMAGARCLVKITSDCESIQRMAHDLSEVDPIREMSFRGDRPMTLVIGEKQCPHAACPVPSAVIKAVEVAAGLALPGDVSIALTAE